MASNATTIGILRILLTADASNWEQVAKKASKDADALSKDFKKVGQQLTDVGKTLTAGITVPLVGLGAAVAKAAMDFESSFANVAKTVDGVSDSSGQLTEKGRELAGAMRQMAKEIPATTSELNAIAALGGQMGVPIDQLEHFTRNVAALGVAVDGISTEEAAAGLAQIGNVAGVGTRDIQQYASTLVHLGNSSNATEADILEFTKRLIGAGNAVGMSVPEVMALGTAMADVGINAEAGGTAMSTMIGKMSMAVSTGGERLEAFAKVAGMTAQQFAETWKRAPVEAVNAIVKGLARIKAEGGDLNLVVRDIGATNIRTADTMKRLAGAGEGVAKAIGIANEGFASGNKHLEEAQKKYATTANQFKVLWNQIKDVGITLGDALLPTLKDLISVAQSLIPVLATAAEWFAALPEPVRLAAVGVAALAAALGPLLIVLGQASIGMSSLVGLFGTTGLATRALAGDFALLTKAAGLLANPFVAVTAAVGGTVLAVKTLTGSWAAAFGVIMPPLGLVIASWNRLKEAIQPHLGLAKDLASIVKSSLVIAWAELKRELEPVVEKFYLIVGAASAVARAITAVIIPALRDLKTEVQAALIQALPMGVREGVAAILFLQSKLPGAKKDVHDLATSLEGYAGALSGTGQASRTAGKDIELFAETAATANTTVAKSGDLIAGWRKELAGLSKTELADLKKHIDLGVLSTKELHEQFGISENAIQLLKKELDNAAAAQKRFGKETKDAKKELEEQRETLQDVRDDLMRLSDDFDKIFDAGDKADAAETLRDFKEELDQIANRIEAIQDPLANAFTLFGIKSREELKKTAAEAVRAYNLIVAEFGRRSPEAIAAYKKMVEAVNAATGTVADKWAYVFENISRSMMAFADTSVSFAERAVDAIQGIFASIGNGLLDKLNAADGLFTKWADKIGGKIGGALSGVFGKLGGMLGAGIGSLVSGGLSALVGLAINALTTWVSNLINKPSMKANDERDVEMTRIAAGFGGTGKSGTGAGTDFAIVAAKLHEATGSNELFERFLKADTPERFRAVMAEVNRVLDAYKEKTDAAAGAIAEQSKALQGLRDQMHPDELKALMDGYAAAVGQGFKGTLDEFMKQQLDFYHTLQEGDARLMTWFSGETIEAYDRIAAAGGDAAAKIRVAFRDATKEIRDELKSLGEEEADLNRSEKAEKNMGTVEKRARARIASRRAELEAELERQRKLMQGQIDTLVTAGGEGGGNIGKSIGDGIADGTQSGVDRAKQHLKDFADWWKNNRPDTSAGPAPVPPGGLAPLGGGDVPQFAFGTPNLDFMNFGRGTLAMLHNEEAVVRKSDAGAFAAKHGGGTTVVVTPEIVAAGVAMALRQTGLASLGSSVGLADAIDRTLAPQIPGMLSRNPSDVKTKTQAALGLR